MKSSSLFLFFAGNLGVFAAPSSTIPSTPNALLQKRASCTPASLGDTQLDDTPAIKAAITTCGNGGTIVIPSGKTYSLRTSLDFAGCINCDFQLEGTLKASTDTTYWATQSAIISLNKIAGAKFRSLTGSGVIDGNGQDAYDIFASDTSLVRPTLFYIQGGSNIAVTGFSVKNPPNVFFAQKGAVSNVQYASLTMTAASKSTNAPKNTDGFDIGESTYTSINNIYVSNQDDCIALKPGSNYVTVKTVTCTGTSHGVSVGSLGKTNADTVKNIYISDLTMIGCTKAVGIKLYEGGSSHGTSTVSNVTYDGVTIDNCDYGAQIQSCYAATDAADCLASPSKAVLTGISFKNFKGTTSAKYAPVTANLNCPSAGTCDISFVDWAVKTPTGTAKVLCDNVDSTSTLGITCVSGASG